MVLNYILVGCPCVFWVGESLLIGSLRWSHHRWFYDRGRLGRVEIVTLSVGVRAKKGEGFPPLFGSFNMALSRLKPFARLMKTPALQANILPIFYLPSFLKVFIDPEEGRPCIPKYWWNIYIFPTVKSALLFLFNITITLFRKNDKMHAVLFLSHLLAIAID